MDVINELIACCEAWEPDVCVMGNVRAGEAAQALRVVRADLTMAEAFHKAAVAQRNAAWAEVAGLRAELAAIRELMNCYNLGGWTDSLALIKERDEAIAELAECKSLLTHAGLIAAQEQHTALRTELAACMVLLDQAYKALKYHREQTRPIHETDEAIAAIDKARKGEGE